MMPPQAPGQQKHALTTNMTQQGVQQHWYYVVQLMSILLRHMLVSSNLSPTISVNFAQQSGKTDQHSASKCLLNQALWYAKSFMPDRSHPGSRFAYHMGIAKGIRTCLLNT